MEDILKVIKRYETFMISSHINPDGDAIGSQLALCSILKDLGKEVLVLNSDPVPFNYKFLLNSYCVYTELSSKADSEITAEVAIILDCGKLNRIGEKLASKIQPKNALINIDHHLGNENFGTHNLVDSDACATGELVFKLMKYAGIEISKYVAECLYTAILTDTGSFKFSNTTAEAHKIIAQLIDKGANPGWIAEKVYEVIPYHKAKLFGMALDNLQTTSDGKIAYMWVTRQMFIQTGAKEEDTEGFAEYVRSLRNIQVGIFFRELDNSDVKVSLRSKGDFDVSLIAARFGGGGHQGAAGCVVSGPLNKSIEAILSSVIAERDSGS